MDISLRQLEAFIKVAEHRSFSKAGDELFLSQSTISSHVAQLEQSLRGIKFLLVRLHLFIIRIAGNFVAELFTLHIGLLIFQ